MTYSVHDEPGFERTYDEDDRVSVRRGDLRALLDVATGSMDFASGFLDNEQVEILRSVATVLAVDPTVVTPSNFICQYRGRHEWHEAWENRYGEKWRCMLCSATSNKQSAPQGLTDLNDPPAIKLVGFIDVPTPDARDMRPLDMMIWLFTACQSLCRRDDVRMRGELTFSADTGVRWVHGEVRFYFVLRIFDPTPEESALVRQRDREYELRYERPAGS